MQTTNRGAVTPQNQVKSFRFRVAGVPVLVILAALLAGWWSGRYQNDRKIVALNEELSRHKRLLQEQNRWAPSRETDPTESPADRKRDSAVTTTGRLARLEQMLAVAKEEREKILLALAQPQDSVRPTKREVANKPLWEIVRADIESLNNLIANEQSTDDVKCKAIFELFSKYGRIGSGPHGIRGVFAST